MRRCVVVLLGLTWWGCTGEERGARPPRTPERPVAQVTELRGDDGRGERLGKFGDACTGASDCRSNVCLHVDQSSRLGGRVCSQRCADTPDECEAGRCVQLFPSDDGWYCVPEGQP